MNKVITITSKGQTTIPIKLRQKIGIPESGGKLKISYNESPKQIVISKPLSFDEISSRAKLNLDPNIKPLVNVDAYYQKNRRKLT